MPPGFAVGLGEGSVLLALVVSGSMGPKQEPILGDLDGVVDQAYPDELTNMAVAYAVGGPGEAHRSARIELAYDLLPGRGLCWPCDLGSSHDPRVVSATVPTIRGA